MNLPNAGQTWGVCGGSCPMIMPYRQYKILGVHFTVYTREEKIIKMTSLSGKWERWS